MYNIYNEVLFAIRRNDLPMTEYFCNMIPNINARLDNGYTLLQEAYNINNDDIVQLLLDKGADISILFEKDNNND